ncbi:MAG: hypothetical protein ACYC6M_03445 [Terriglobales bacterium]
MNKPRLSKYSLIHQGNRAIVCEGRIRLALVDTAKLDHFVKENGRRLAADEDIQWALKHALISKYRVFNKPMSSRELETAAAIDS